MLEGTGTDPGAKLAAAALSDAGFEVLTRTNTGTVHELTTIMYRPQDGTEAALLARWIDGPVLLEENEWLDTEGVALITGLDWNGVRSEPAPTTTTTIDIEGTTSTTGLGIVPGETSAVDLCA